MVPMMAGMARLAGPMIGTGDHTARTTGLLKPQEGASVVLPGQSVLDPAAATAPGPEAAERLPTLPAIGVGPAKMVSIVAVAGVAPGEAPTTAGEATAARRNLQSVARGADPMAGEIRELVVKGGRSQLGIAMVMVVQIGLVERVTGGDRLVETVAEVMVASKRGPTTAAPAGSGGTPMTLGRGVVGRLAGRGAQVGPVQHGSRRVHHPGAQ